jgi:hypothetical protein
MGLKTGTLGSATDAVTLQKPSTDSFCLVTVTGTFTGLAFTVEGAIGSGTDTPSAYAPVSFVNRALFARDVDDALSSLSTSQTLEINGSGLKWLRVRATAWSSGTADVTIYSDDVTPLTQLGGG